MTENKQKPTTKKTSSDKKPNTWKLRVHRYAPQSRGSWLVAVCAGLLLVGVVAYAVVDSLNSSTDSTMKVYNEPTDLRFPKEEVVMEQLSFEALQARVNNLELSNQYTDAKKLIKYQEYYGDNKQAQLLYASISVNQGNQKEALQTMLKLEDKFGESGTLAGNIARQATSAGDEKLAESYYNKAIDLTEKDKSNPVREADANLYKAELKKLKEN